VLVPTRWHADELPPRQFAPDGVCQPIAVGAKLSAPAIPISQSDLA
jgi:hypothetical protein